MLKYERVPEEIRNLSSSQFQEIADHFHETLKPLFGEDTPKLTIQDKIIGVLICCIT